MTPSTTYSPSLTSTRRNWRDDGGVGFLESPHVGPHLPHSGRTDLRLVVPRTPLPFRHAGREGRCANGTGNGSRERDRSTRPSFASTTNRLATGFVRHEGR